MQAIGLPRWHAACTMPVQKEGKNNENEIAGIDASGGRIDVR
jgi:hypothetical protein